MSTLRGGVLAVCVVVVALGCGKADLNVDCSVDGFGTGNCQFTNTGNRSGRMCGRVVVFRSGPHWGFRSGQLYPGDWRESEIFCSGEVERSDTRSVPFQVPEVRELCDPSGTAYESWRDMCSFNFKLDTTD